jgi:glycosyltransferase involved in cell wall biosynthesis
MSSPYLSVVIPLYNEEENVPVLQKEIQDALKDIDYELILIDDGSSDKTLERIEMTPRVRVLKFEKNTGQSAAMYAGLNAAHGEVAVLLDGDLQNDPADVPKLLAEIEKGADLVCGTAPSARTQRSKSCRVVLPTMCAVGSWAMACAIPGAPSKPCAASASPP